MGQNNWLPSIKMTFTIQT
uniref:Uncharacterized protein n=1 Tax=Anguilla anguilla TaxID=7936 RepID=A0A0E9P772_ANGAN